MAFKFAKDRKYQELLSRMDDAVSDVSETTNTIQQRAGIIANISMINDWYIQENSMAIHEHGEDADMKHLEQCVAFFEKYGQMIREIDVVLNDTIQIISDNFDYKDEDIQNTIERLKRFQ
jgi:hypothetical protein